MLGHIAISRKYHQSFSKNSGGRIEKRSFVFPFTSDDEQRAYEIRCDAAQLEAYRNLESIPRKPDSSSSGKPPRIKTLILPNGRQIREVVGAKGSANDKHRINGSILQNGRGVYIVLDEYIWNKHGACMASSVDSDNYRRIGQCYKGIFLIDTWYDESILELRR